MDQQQDSGPPLTFKDAAHANPPSQEGVAHRKELRPPGEEHLPYVQ